MKKKDVLLILIVLAISTVIFISTKIMNKGNSDKIEIYVDNRLYKSIPINSEEEITIENNEDYNHIKIYDKGAKIIDASCPDKVCVKSGFIKDSNEKIVCIPNKVIIKIKKIKTTNNKEDAISN